MSIFTLLLTLIWYKLYFYEFNFIFYIILLFLSYVLLLFNIIPKLLSIINTYNKIFYIFFILNISKLLLLLFDKYYYMLFYYYI